MTELEYTYEALSDIYVVSNDLGGRPGFTLTAIARNELYFLPAFLKHYRRLGVERFIILDDQSDDGSRDYLSWQTDVMVLGTTRRYGERLKPPPGITTAPNSDYRMATLWRQYLLDTFAIDSWSLHVDLDEFLFLPEGTSFPAIAATLDPMQGEVVWAVMLDTYPAHISDLAAAQNETELDIVRDWYFDGRTHVRFGKRGPEMVYGGSRSRLITQHGLHEQPTLKDKVRWYLRDHWLWRYRARPPVFNDLRKPSLLYWRLGDQFHSVHRMAKVAFCDRLLPMLHFKFTGAVYAKVKWAIESNAYYRGSREYHNLSELLMKLQELKAPLIDPAISVRYDTFADFERTGNALGQWATSIRTQDAYKG